MYRVTKFSVGDRIQVREGNGEGYRFRPGDKGTITNAPETGFVGVKMDNGYTSAGPWLSSRFELVPQVHNHPPYEPPCNERVVDGNLRGACLADKPEPTLPDPGRDPEPKPFVDLESIFRRKTPLNPFRPVTVEPRKAGKAFRALGFDLAEAEYDETTGEDTERLDRIADLWTTYLEAVAVREGDNPDLVPVIEPEDVARMISLTEIYDAAATGEPII